MNCYYPIWWLRKLRSRLCKWCSWRLGQPRFEPRGSVFRVLTRFFLKPWVRCQGGETKQMAKDRLEAASFRLLIKGTKMKFINVKWWWMKKICSLIKKQHSFKSCFVYHGSSCMYQALGKDAWDVVPGFSLHKTFSGCLFQMQTPDVGVRICDSKTGDRAQEYAL